MSKFELKLIPSDDTVAIEKGKTFQSQSQALASIVETLEFKGNFTFQNKKYTCLMTDPKKFVKTELGRTKISFSYKISLTDVETGKEIEDTLDEDERISLNASKFDTRNLGTNIWGKNKEKEYELLQGKSSHIILVYTEIVEIGIKRKIVELIKRLEEKNKEIEVETIGVQKGKEKEKEKEKKKEEKMEEEEEPATAAADGFDGLADRMIVFQRDITDLVHRTDITMDEIRQQLQQNNSAIVLKRLKDTANMPIRYKGEILGLDGNEIVIEDTVELVKKKKEIEDDIHDLEQAYQGMDDSDVNKRYMAQVIDAMKRQCKDIMKSFESKPEKHHDKSISSKQKLDFLKSVTIGKKKKRTKKH